MSTARQPMLPVLFSLGAAVPFGCNRPCVGAGCAETYAGALAGVLRGGDLAGVVEGSPLDTWASVRGTRDLGSDWDVDLAAGALLVGAPVGDSALLFALGTGGRLEVADATASIMGEAAEDRFGHAVAFLDAANGGPGLVVGAPGRDHTNASRDEGAVYVFEDLGPGAAGDWSAEQAEIRISGDAVGEGLGERVAACGDVDGDGAPDWVAAAPLADAEDALAGSVLLGASGAVAGIGRAGTAAALGSTWTGTGVGARAGSAVACADDVDGDRVPDLLVGAPYADGDHEAEGAVYLLPGAPLPAAGPLAGAASQVLRGWTAEAWLGWSIATGDIDGDGLADVAAGAPGAEQGAGLVFVWPGATLVEGGGPLPSFRVHGEAPGDRLGRALAIGDLDGDGYADLAMGAPERNPSETGDPASYDSGALYVFRGAASWAGWRANLDAGAADLVLVDTQQYLRTGQLVRAADFDGDGTGDLALLHRYDPD